VHTSNHGLLRRWKSRNQKKIRIAAEEEEMQSYESRMSSDWLDDLKPLVRTGNLF
jgi:hypothetical protein